MILKSDFGENDDVVVGRVVVLAAMVFFYKHLFYIAKQP